MTLKIDPVSSVIDSVSSGVEKVAGVFTTNKEKDAQRSADEQMALMKAYQAEFNQRENRNWVDSLADGFNRLIRPFIVTIIISIFIIAYISPARLAEITLAISAIPEGYWTLLSIIIAFYFGGRMQLKSQEFKFNDSQAQAIKTLIETREDFRKLAMDTDEPDRVHGEKRGKDATLDESRLAQENPVVAAALKTTKDDQQALAAKVEEMKSESPDSVKKRRRFGPRKRFR